MKCTVCNEEVKPVVAWDIDGTLGRYHEHLLDFMNMYFGRDLPDGWTGEGDWNEYLGLTKSAYRDAKLAFRQGGTKRWMPAFAGASKAVEHTRALGAEVWIATTRPYLRLDSVDPDTREWLSRNEIFYDYLLYDDNKYTQLHDRVGARVAAVVEDLPEQYTKAAIELGWNVPIMMERQHNLTWRSKCEATTVRNMNDAAWLVERRIYEWKNAHHA